MIPTQKKKIHTKNCKLKGEQKQANKQTEKKGIANYLLHKE